MLSKFLSWKRKVSLHHAVAIGDIDVLAECVEKCSVKAVNKRDRDGFTALHLATLHDYRTAIRLLLENGADSNCTDKMGRTPLHVASARGYPEVVQMLVRNGADVALKDKDGLKAIDVICKCILDKRRTNAIKGLLSLAELKVEKKKTASEEECLSLEAILARRLALCDPCAPADPSAQRVTSDDKGMTSSPTSLPRLGYSTSLPHARHADWVTDEAPEIYENTPIFTRNSRETARHLRVLEPIADVSSRDLLASSRRTFSSFNALSEERRDQRSQGTK